MDYEGKDEYSGYPSSPMTAVEDYTTTARQYQSETATTTDVQQYAIPTDDYSATSDFEEQSGYNLNYKPTVEDYGQQVQFMLPPEIVREKKEEPVVLPTFTRQKQKLHIGGRMKIVACSFAIIMAVLVFAIAWNIIAISKLAPILLQKENKINELQTSISTLTDEYNLLDSDSYLKMRAEEAGFIETDDINVRKIKLHSEHEEREQDAVKSNWFNDVCDFLNKVFG